MVNIALSFNALNNQAIIARIIIPVAADLFHLEMIKIKKLAGFQN